MRILGIETSCDETGLAIIEAQGGLKSPRFRVLKNLVASQIKIHRPFGGVVPNLAKREHLKNLPVLFRQIFGVKGHGSRLERGSPKAAWVKKIDLVAVTVGPGLEPALWTGINFAQQIYSELKPKNYKLKPALVGANHLEGHLYSFLLPPKSRTYNLKTKSLFPAVALIVSGGHTILLKMDSFVKWKRLGETRDDAAGEAFDKVARLLDLPYPGGPEIEKIAKRGDPTAINFPRPMLAPRRSSAGLDQKNPVKSDTDYGARYDFSFSGLKTAVLYYIRDSKLQIHSSAANRLKADIAASFQQAAIDVLVAKTMRAAREFGAKSIMLSGGVAANKALRRVMSHESRVMGLKFLVPDFKYNLDNAAMIAGAGYMAHLRSKASSGQAHLRKKRYKLEAQGGLDI